MLNLTLPSTFPVETIESSEALHVIIAHDDHAAYLRALRMLANTFYGHPEAASLRPLPWRFDELESDTWRRRAVSDAPRAQVFVISKSGEGDMPATVYRWLEECFALRKDFSTAVIALCDDAGALPGASCRRRLRQMAVEAGLDFLEAHAPVPVAG